MQAALDATTLMIATLKKHSEVSGDTGIAIIPFRTVVDIGTEYADAPWITYDGIITEASWGGCLADRDQPNDVKDSAPGASATSFPFAEYGSLAQALPLTSDWAALEAKVDSPRPDFISRSAHRRAFPRR
jgi:hypothetical protein